MEQSLRALFERALDDEPEQPAGELARQAIASGTRLRRRRRLVAAGTAAAVVALLATVAAVTVPASTGQRTDGRPPAGRQDASVPGPLALLLADTGCSWPARSTATDVAIFLSVGVTERQRQELEDTLRYDPLVKGLWYENRNEAYSRFKQLYSESPDLLGSTTLEQLPESFRVTLAQPAKYPTFRARFTGWPGVEEVIGSTCPKGTSAREGE